MAEAEFVGKVREKLHDIGIRERDLRSQLEALAQERGHYETALSVWTKEMQNGAAPATSEPVYDDELQNLSVAEAATVVMRRFGGQVRVANLARMLRTVGVTKAKGAGAYSTVLKTLQRKVDIFYEIETGQWGLVEFKNLPPPAHTSAVGMNQEESGKTG